MDDLNTSESVTENTETTANETPESNEPSSMLEAIQEGLKADEPEAEEKVEDEEPEAVEPEAAKPEEESKPENEDEPPEGISKKAQERFRNLTTRLKEKDSEVQALRSDLDGIRAVLKDTGASPEDFGRMFDYMKALTSGDMNRVRSVLEEQIRQYTMMTGQQIGQVDPLAQFPDLRERVNGYQMDEQAAIEVARLRHVQQQQNQMAQQYQQRQQAEQQATQTRQQAMQNVDRMASEWAKRDPDYAMKEEIILKQIPAIAKQFHPSQWANQVEILYNTLSQVPMQRPVSPAPAPLRSSGVSGGARQPGNMLEALQNGLGYRT